MANFFIAKLRDDAPCHLVEVGLHGAYRRGSPQHKARHELIKPHTMYCVQEELGLSELQVLCKLNWINVVRECGNTVTGVCEAGGRH